MGNFINKIKEALRGDFAETSDLADVATSGDYDDLTNKPIIPTLPTLATVATSGDYDDLINKPTIQLSVDLLEVVEELPTASENTLNKLYCVLEDYLEEDDSYKVYVTVKTGSNNNYSYSWERIDMRVDLADYVVYDDLESYVTYYDLESVLEDIIDDALTKTTITFNIQTDNGETYSGIEIHLNKQPSQPNGNYSDETDDNGSCTIENIDYGDYQIELYGFGIQSISGVEYTLENGGIASFTVDANTPNTITVILEPQDATTQ